MRMGAPSSSSAAFPGGIYDNLKTAVDAILRDRDRRFNRRCLRYARITWWSRSRARRRRGWKKGREPGGQCPGVAVSPAAEVRDPGRAQCLAQGEVRRDSAEPRTPRAAAAVWEVFQGERGSLLVLPAPFDGYREEHCRVSATSLIRFDHNRYSVNARAVGQW